MGRESRGGRSLGGGAGEAGGGEEEDVGEEETAGSGSKGRGDLGGDAEGAVVVVVEKGKDEVDDFGRHGVGVWSVQAEKQNGRAGCGRRRGAETHGPADRDRDGGVRISHVVLFPGALQPQSVLDVADDEQRPPWPPPTSPSRTTTPSSPFLPSSRTPTTATAPSLRT